MFDLPFGKGDGWMGEIDGNGSSRRTEGGSKTDVWLCGNRFIVLYDKTFPLRGEAGATGWCHLISTLSLHETVSILLVRVSFRCYVFIAIEDSIKILLE